jgi:hypothetical protein
VDVAIYIFMRLIGWLSIPLLVLAVLIMIRSIKRQNRLRMRALVIPLVTTLFVPLVYVAILGTTPWYLGILLFIVGLGIGVIWANTTVLELRDGEVFGARSVGYIIVWGFTFVLSQTLALTAGTLLVGFGLSTIFLSMGIALGTNGNLIYRRSAVAAGKPDAPIGPVVGRRA